MGNRSADVYGAVAGGSAWGWAVEGGEWRSGPRGGAGSAELAALADLGRTLGARGGELDLVRVGSAETIETLVARVADDAGQGATANPGDEAGAVLAAWPAGLPRLELRDSPAPREPFVVLGARPGALASPEVRAEILAHESLILGPEGRTDPAAIERLVHRDFDETGRTGYYWPRHEVVAKLQELPYQTERIEFDRVIELAPGIAHIRFTTYDDRGIVRRSSIWVHEDGRWQQRYHQGTPDVQQG